MEKARARGLANIRTAQRCKIHAKPKSPDTTHLDLFLLRKNRDRLEQERHNVEERLARVKKDIQGIDEEIAKTSNSAPAAVAAPERHRDEKLPRSMKKMDLQY